MHIYANDSPRQLRSVERSEAIQRFRFLDYLQDNGLFHDVSIIDFEYTLVDINLLDREYLLQNHDAICAALAVDTIHGDGYADLTEALDSIVKHRVGFNDEDYSDFVSWFKNTVVHRTASDQEATVLVDMLLKGDNEDMATGLNTFLDKVEDKGKNKGKAAMAINLLNRGYSVDEVAEIAEMPIEWVEQLSTDESLVS